ncbi:4-oxalomesaconate tautomerase [Scleromatobacter humisilvae]|uniref:4-oxalomesaconate tautomerase n=1 Tax=Scleromatobacter humisilvae TaxID=2897159 RepID=A0A9X1YFE6_9BURK|nr:4-oxalomesaconate tautomerase [Scleromatobacter humisilvae]MCK9685379.1 4-oxalomesaconate tautomerase [Scleromatobacter humisilvae]
MTTNLATPASPRPGDEVPCTLMRGGTSKGAYFLATDLPADAAARDTLILGAMGHGEPRQIDGIGGGTPLTTKVAIVSRSTHEHADIDYLFGQVVAHESRIDYAPTCGNILAGVGPFAIEQGLVPARDGDTAVRIRMVNTDSLCTAVIRTPDGRVQYAGDTAISGVPGTAAPVLLKFAGIAGSSCGALLPTGRVRDVVDGVAVTCIDHGMPVVVLRASAVGASGYETPQSLDADVALKARVERIRLLAGPLMGLGDVADKVVPKMTLVAPAIDGGAIHTRTFIPKRCHDAIGVLGAVSVATACLMDDSVAAEFVPRADAREQYLSIEHPSGEFTVRLVLGARPAEFESVALLRTARALFRGQVVIPGNDS